MHEIEPDELSRLTLGAGRWAADAAVLYAVRRLGGTVSSAELIHTGAAGKTSTGCATPASRSSSLAAYTYRLADAPATAHLDLLAVCRRAPEDTICLHSAACYRDLTDQTPPAVHLTLGGQYHSGAEQRR